MGAQWKQKGREASANAKGKIFNKLVRELIIAAKAGPDPSLNARLRVAVEAAKKASMPRDTLERSIKRGAGLLDEGVTLETVTYEGFAPHQVPVVVECLTDNKNRTATNIRHHFRKGQMTPVLWDFIHVGLLDAAAADAGVDPEESAIEAGAQDFEPDGEGGFHFYTEPADLDSVAKALTGRGWTVASMRIGWRPKNPVKLDEAARAEVDAFLSTIDEDDDVQHIYVGLA
ncbi:MAG TPA: YebC/PmpR family DNA-binding transcriptional regulator [Kofleriaceae bacterium]|nr:YebC/PmpR family DNA-binding transcriptional regulator [Kofleriaceae bacterium]